MTRQSLLLRAGLTAALLGTTAATGAFAQESQQTASGDIETCDDLRVTLEQNSDRIKTEMRADATAMVREGDDQKCVDFFNEAAVDPAATAQPGAQPEQTDQAQGQIVVTQPEPTIQVEQTAPQVAVRQQQPQVTVNQGQPQIEVHQAQPVIHVQVPQPVITIDQPQPQIIVRMPNPQVAVNAPTPEIEVRQGQPKVSVQQAKPQVQVLGENQGAEVNVDQQQPKVVQQMAEGQPEVQVERGQPKVQFFPAEPKVQVEASGEPQVKFNQSGEPDIRVEQLAATRETSAAQPGNEPAATQPDQQGNAEQVANVDEQANAARAGANTAADPTLALILLPQGQEVQQGQPQAYQAAALIGQPISNWKGENLGTIDSLASDGTRQFVILAPDTPLGDGNGGVILPLETIAFVDGKLVMQGMTEQQINDLTQYDTNQLQQLQGEQVNIATR